MKTPIFIGTYAVFLLAAANAFAEQKSDSSKPTADKTEPKTIACAQEVGEALGQCSYRVKRDENGKTTVTVIFSNGFKRGLFFLEGEFQKGSVTMSGVGTDTDWSQEDGMHFIRVDDQRYEVPDTLIAGD